MFFAAERFHMPVKERRVYPAVRRIMPGLHVARSDSAPQIIRQRPRVAPAVAGQDDTGLIFDPAAGNDLGLGFAIIFIHAIRADKSIGMRKEMGIGIRRTNKHLGRILSIFLRFRFIAAAFDQHPILNISAAGQIIKPVAVGGSKYRSISCAPRRRIKIFVIVGIQIEDEYLLLEVVYF